MKKRNKTEKRGFKSVLMSFIAIFLAVLVGASCVVPAFATEPDTAIIYDEDGNPVEAIVEPYEEEPDETAEPETGATKKDEVVSADDESISSHDISSETENENSNSSTTEKTATENNYSEDVAPSESVIFSYDTDSDGDKTNQVTISVVCPSDYDDIVCMFIMNTETGQRYELQFSPSFYEDHIFLPIGTYSITNFYSQNNSNVDFDINPKTITIEKSGYSSYQFKMSNLDTLQKDENGDYYDPALIETVEEENKLSTEVRNETCYEFATYTSKGEIFYDVLNDSSSAINLKVEGFANKSADCKVVITKGGLIEEGAFSLYIDGEKYCTSATDFSVKISSLGITLYFSTDVDTNEFIEDETFTFKIGKCFASTSTVYWDKASMFVCGNPTENADYEVEVLSSGGPGVSKIKITDKIDEENIVSDVVLIPEDGVLKWKNGVIFYFYGEGGFNKGVKFASSIHVKAEEEDYTPVYYMAAVAAAIAIVVVFLLISKKDKKSSYVIRPYKGRQDESVYRK